MEWEIELHDEVDQWFVDLCRDDPVSAGSSEIRILFAFDPPRRALPALSPATRSNWKGWYDRNIPIAEHRFREHLRHGEER
jgi:hypothetical protein